MSPDLLAGRYELIERIASGGMGQVWRGRDRVLERVVAIKTVDLAAQDPTARERFRREAIATAGLSAPNIVQVFDAGVDGHTAFLVMELLTGPTLSQVIHDHGPLPIEAGAGVALEVARALLTAHRIGIVHRDIKPGNVMYHESQVKLVDFGIAQLARSLGAALTAPATAMGTAAYMAPEQAVGEGATDKSDWYAFGCLLTTMFTGQPPFSGDALAVANQQINAQPPFLSERRPEVPFALDSLVAALLAKDPAARPSGEQVIEQLRQLAGDPTASTVLLGPGASSPATTALYPEGGTAMLAGSTAAPTRGVTFGESPVEPPVRPVTPVPPPPPLPAARPAQAGRRVWPIVVAAVLVVVLGGVGAYLLLGDRAPSAPAATASPTARPTTQPTPSATPSRRPTPTPSRTPATRTPTPPPATASRPTLSPTPDAGEPENGNQDATAEAQVQNAIAEVESRVARPVLAAMWVEARFSGSPDHFFSTIDQLERQGLLSVAEGQTLTQAAEAALE